MRLTECGDGEKMEILTSGSFVSLENREKIEQLIFTAKELCEGGVSKQKTLSAHPKAISDSPLRCGKARSSLCRAIASESQPLH